MKNSQIVLSIITLLIAAACSEPDTGNNSAVDPVVEDLAAIDTVYPPSVVELEFESFGDRLNGHIYQANGAGPHPTVILLHGYPGNEKNLDLAQALRRAGFNVLFFHYRGAWGSEGAFSFTHVIEDVASAASLLRARAEELRVDPKRLILIGHSMGGFAALQGAANDDDVACVAGIAAADIAVRVDALAAGGDMAEMANIYADSLQMLSGWSGEKMRTEIIANKTFFSLVDLAPKLSGKSVLLVAGNKDSVLPPEFIHVPMVTAYSSEPGIKLTDVVLSGDHSFSWSRIALIRTVVDWAEGCR